MNNKRIRKLRDVLEEKSIAAILISSPESIGYYSNFFNFSPTEREALMLVTKDTVYLMTDSRFTGMITAQKGSTVIETSARAGAYDEIKKIVEDKSIASIGYEESNLTVREYTQLKRATGKATKLFAISPVLQELLKTKSKSEIKAIQNACEITDNAFRYIQAFIISGVTEIELADRLEGFFKRNDASPAFPPIVAFGENAAIPHHHPSNKKLTPEDRYILFDFGSRYNNYCSDLSRTVFIGTISDEIHAQYTAVLESQKKAIESLSAPVRTGKTVDAVARNYLKEHSFEVPHAVGHGIGLSVHEAPNISPLSTTPLIEDMVITIEPGLYIPSIGGIRIEDTVLVTKKGYRVLTKSPKELLVLS